MFGPSAIFILPDRPDAAYRAKLQEAINQLGEDDGRGAAQDAFDEEYWMGVYALRSDNQKLPTP